MSEKDMFLASYEREVQTTIKVFKALPQDKLDFKPHEVSRSAQHLAWTVANEQIVDVQALAGKISWEALPAEPKGTIHEIVEIFEKNAQEAAAAIKNASDEVLNQMIDFGAMKMRVMDVIWFMFYDQIHHRGQFSVYVRMAGGKVPAIYGPSFDEKGY